MPVVEPKVLDELIDLGEQQARRVLIGTKQQLVPSFVLWQPAGAQIVVTPWANEREKECALAVLKTKMRQDGVTAYSMLTEGWRSIYPLGTDLDNLPYMPRNDPKREECVSIMATDGVNTRFRSFTMKRDRAGRCKELVLDDFNTPESHITSRWDNLLGGTA